MSSAGVTYKKLSQIGNEITEIFPRLLNPQTDPHFLNRINHKRKDKVPSFAIGIHKLRVNHRTDEWDQDGDKWNVWQMF